MNGLKLMQKAFRGLSFLIISFFMIPSLLGDEVKLKSGKILKNLKLEKEAPDYYIFTLEDAIPVRILKSEVESITNTKEDKGGLVLENKPSSPGLPAAGKRNYDVVWTQALTNDVFINGNSLYGNSFDRRGDLRYSNMPKSLILDTTVVIPTALEGLNLTIREYSPLTARTNRDVDSVYQSHPYGPAATPAQMAADPGTYQLRKETNGLREGLAGLLNYRWTTNRLGDFNTGWIYYVNTQPDFALSLFTFGWTLPVLQYLHPHYQFNMRTSSERIGGASIGGEKDQESGYPTNAFNGSTFHRFSINHEYEITQDLKIQPSIDVGYQYYNDNIDRRSGIRNIDYKVTLKYLGMIFSITDVYRPNTYMIDNSYYYPNTVGGQTVGTVPGANLVQPLTSNTNDGLTIDPSKGYGLVNQYVLNSIMNSSLDPNVKQALVNKHLEQRIPLHSIIWSFGYTIRI
ncbi:hypothetical protein EHO59_14285 [Leptospira semungkisensis]|uniref:Porin n=1 Tax=Leptospira semungkisensis TaxID=2484985 RepID=A0A4R9FQU3_9LEPT|nr:hypothetical protein [Leptospira semungkisensis]TGK01078.1 hypothetical protein EHO59_14285 [Leptospira semungkisensis]